MYREILSAFSSDELKINTMRFENMVTELKFCLQDLEEKREELKSTNEMLKSAIEAFKFNPTPTGPKRHLEQSNSLTMSTQSTEVCETFMDDSEDLTISKVKHFPCSPNKVSSPSHPIFQSNRVSRFLNKQRTLHKSSASMQNIVQAEVDEERPQRVSIDISEEISLPQHYYKAKTMEENRLTPYRPRKAPRYPRKSLKDTRNA